MKTTLTQCPTRDGELLYDWLRANFRYFMAGETCAADDGRRRSRKELALVTVRALLPELSPVEQERTLRFATGARFHEELGPVEEGCRCRWCEPARQRQQEEQQTPREQRVREALTQRLARLFVAPSWEQPRSRSAHCSYGRPPVRVPDRDAEAGTLPNPAVVPEYKKSQAILRFFFGTKERLSVFLQVAPPAWPLLSKLLGPPPAGEDADYPPDVLDCVEAVAAHLAYAPTVPVATQRQFLAWTFGEPKVGGSCQMPDCSLPKELPHPWHEVPDDRVQHKFGHALQDLLLDALRHKCPINRGLGMPLIHGLSGAVHVSHIIVGNPYVYYPS